MKAQAYLIDTDAHDVVHIRRKDTKECVGCIEAGLYWLVRSIVIGEVQAVLTEQK